MTLSQNNYLNWLYIDINSYFATVEQQLDCSIRNKPVAIVPLFSDTTCAIAASYEAKKMGIKTGTIIKEAKKICPELICIKARQSLYAEYHKKIFQEIDQHLHVDHIFSIDEGACKLTGALRNAADAISIAQHIKQKIKSNIGDYITCSIGIAPNRYLAKIASNMQKPDGLTVIRSEDLPDVLYKLNLRDLPGVGNKTYKRLIDQGVATTEQLHSYSRPHLRALWGSIWGEKIWYLIRGVDLPLEDSKTSCISQSQVLAPELRNIEGARSILLSLVLKAASRLRSKQLLTNNVSINLKLLGNKKSSNSLKISFANDNYSLIKTLLQMFDNLTSSRLKLSIVQVSIGFNNLREEVDQLSFKFDANQDKNKKLSQLIDHLNKRYGNNSVRIGLLKNHNQTQDCAAFGYIPSGTEKISH